jgi:hypothetical protein
MINQIEKEELFRVLGTQIPRLQISEFEAAYRNNADKADDATVLMKLIEADINARRDKFSGGATYLPAGGWDKIFAQADDEARWEILQSSDVLANLNELEAKALDAKRAAEQAAALEALWSEFNSLAPRSANINKRLTALEVELQELQSEKLASDFRKLYRATLDGAHLDQFATVFASALIVTANLRREVIEELQSELKAELATLQKRNKALCRQLGQSQTI